MSGNDTHVARGDLDELHVTSCPTWERDALRGHTAETPGIVGCLIRRKEARSLCELVDAHTVLQDDYNSLL